MERPGTAGFVLHLAVLLVLFLGLSSAVFAARGTLLRLELLITAGLLALAVLAMWRYLAQGETAMLLLVYAASMLNVVVLFISLRQLASLPLLLSAIGVFLALVLREQPAPAKEQEPWATKDVKIEEIEPEHVSEAPAAAPAKRGRKPGKRKRGRPRKQ